MQEHAPGAGPANRKKNYFVDKAILGEGTFATVKRAVHRQTGQAVALKIIYKNRLMLKEVCATLTCGIIK